VKELLGLTLEELRRYLSDELGEPAYRATQLFVWIHQRGESDFQKMSNLPAPLARSSTASAPPTVG
jgi:23S rRNA (adenine2503-C2)-methyltransferase